VALYSGELPFCIGVHCIVFVMRLGGHLCSTGALLLVLEFYISP
jgi:hypothetical protein